MDAGACTVACLARRLGEPPPTSTGGGNPRRIASEPDAGVGRPSPRGDGTRPVKRSTDSARFDCTPVPARLLALCDGSASRRPPQRAAEIQGGSRPSPRSRRRQSAQTSPPLRFPGLRREAASPERSARTAVRGYGIEARRDRPSPPCRKIWPASLTTLAICQTRTVVTHPTAPSEFTDFGLSWDAPRESADEGLRRSVAAAGNGPATESAAAGGSWFHPSNPATPAPARV